MSAPSTVGPIDATKIAELVARDRIRELVAAYTHLGDGGRLDEMAELFEADATLDAFGTTYQGRPAIKGFFGGIVEDRADAPARTFVRHHISNVTISLDGENTATGASYWVVYSDNGFESSGRYRDAYRCGDDGVWRFRTRKIRRDEPRPSTS